MYYLFCHTAGESRCMALWFDLRTLWGQGEEDFQEGILNR